jgi:hypothetical protein
MAAREVFMVNPADDVVNELQLQGVQRMFRLQENYRAM